MKFHGFQKLTLLDFPGKVACTVFTGGCNFRCPFCHNALLVTELEQSESFDSEEILAFLSKRVGMLDGICVTGGEPLLQPGLHEFLQKVKELGFAVKLDTNGSFPDRLRSLVADGLVDFVAVDIKNRPEKYAETVGLPDFDLTPIRETLEFLKTDAVPYELRTTVVREFHNVEDIAAIADWIAGAKRYYLQNFVDSGNLIGSDLHAVSKEEMILMRDTAAAKIPSTELRGI